MDDEPVSSGSTRRDFVGRLGRYGAAAIAGLSAANSEAQIPATTKELQTPENVAAQGEVPRRKFGKTDAVVSALGLGGHAFAQAKTEEEAIRIVHEAIDNGITFMDN